VVINKTDQNPAYDLNRQHLRAKYPNIKGFFKLSCADGSGIEAFKTALSEEIQQVEYMRSLWPKTWFDVKNALQTLKDHYITQHHYHTICRDNHLDNESQQKTLLEYLHNLGVILHFPAFELKEYQVLEPKWVTEAVYKIINSKSLADKKGYLDKQMLEEILNTETFDETEYRPSLENTRYTTREQLYVVALMKAFELCYEVEAGGGSLLVPDLLAVAEPVDVAGFDKSAALRFIYRFDYLPAGIMPRFIVNMNRDIKDPGLQWRTGVVLENKSYAASALVKADKECKEIYIDVNGDGKQDYFPVIRHCFNKIIDSFQDLKMEELVPLPGYDYLNVTYKELIGHERDAIEKYYNGELRKYFPVAQLLKGIKPPPDSDGPHGKGDFHLHLHKDKHYDNSVTHNITVTMPELRNSFADLEELLEGQFPELAKRLKKLDNDLHQLDPGSDEKQLRGPLTRLGDLLQKLGDEDSKYSKYINGSKKAFGYAKTLAGIYDNLARWVPYLPRIPDGFLGKK
ncbi:MAG: hypothetical protein GY757_07945, partial [bacterium]|nr:hypothetical protein [bacterium]